MLSKRRTLRVGLTGTATLISKFINLAAGLVSIPLTAKYLGTDRFALWLILSSFLGWASIADLGLANSLTNILAKADSKGDRETAQITVSNTFYLLVILSLVTGIVCSVAFFVVPWNRIINVDSSLAIAEIPSAVFVTMMLLIFRLVLSLPRQIYGAYQEGYLYQIWSTLGNILALIGLWIAVNLQGNSALLLSAFFGFPLLSDLAAIIHLFKWKSPWLEPKLKQFSWQESKALLKTGLQIWISQISGIVLFQTDIIIVSQLFGATEVVTYGTLLKLFAVIAMIQSAFVSPLWPAYCESLSTGDISWVVTTFQKSVFASLLWAITIGIILTYTAPYIISNWIGQYQSLGSTTLIAFLLRSVLLAIDQCIGALGNGLGLFGFESILAPSFAIGNLSLSLYLVNQIGISGIAWSTCICVLLFSFMIYGSYCFTRIKTIKNKMAFYRS
jgi:O-antigen/teichoic acid export membrane protein